MSRITMECVLPQFINNTVYRDKHVRELIQVALAAVEIEEDHLPLTVVSSFYNVPGKLGYFYAPSQLQQDKDDGIFTMSPEQFDRARYGVVRLKLGFAITAEQFLTTAIHEYIHATQDRTAPKVQSTVSNKLIVVAKEQAAYDRAAKLSRIVRNELWVVEILSQLNHELSWL